MPENEASKRDYIVVSVFACHPEMSSEAGIGWVFLRNMVDVASARDMRIIAVMNGRSAVASRAALQNEGLDEVVEIVPIDPPRGLQFLLDPRLTRLEYLVWNARARASLKAGVASKRASLAIHSTFASELLPAPIVVLPKSVYRVWGPVGSAGSPRVFKIRPREPKWFINLLTQYLRNRISVLAARRNARNVDLVLAQSLPLAQALRVRGATSEVFPNVVLPDGISAAVLPSPNRIRSGGLRLLAAGHLHPRKRFGLAIAMLGEPGLESATLEIAGQAWPGVDDYLPRVAEAFGVSDRVHFLGKVPRRELIGLMSGADVFVHLSAREGASGTVGEATAVGVPVVCFSGTGAASVVEEAGAQGVVLDAHKADLSSIAGAVLEASGLPRVRFGGWTESRIQQRLGELVDHSLAR